MAYQILADNGLERFYTLESTPGIKPLVADETRFAALDQPDVRRRLVDFSNGKITRVTFRIPAIHCAACVWLLENLYRLIPGVGRSEVNFPRKEVAIFIDDAKVRLSELANRLTSLGYAPELKLDRLSAVTAATGKHRLLMQIGIAGFAFGNVMMMSFPSYLGLNPETESSLLRFFGMASLGLAIPVLLFSAQDYYRNAWHGLKQRMLTIDFPIALGISALFLQSSVDIIRHTGEGYLDSFTGLVFLLLCGKWLQRTTYDSMAFDRDYRSYFPLSVTRRKNGQDESIALTELVPGDRIILRHGELIPADAVIMAGQARLDYSFVTGEAEPVENSPGEYVYAGARQTGGLLEIELVKDVSQSYLTSLWNNDAFHKPRERNLEELTNRVGRWFTAAVVVIAAVTALYWWNTDPSQLARTFSAVLIVACPCALALAAPFTFSSAQQKMGRAGLFLRSPSVVEALAGTDLVVFDKTGTLTSGQSGSIVYEGTPLNADEAAWAGSLARRSAHPVSRHISQQLNADLAVEWFESKNGFGISGVVAGHKIRIGSATWARVDADTSPGGTWLSIDGCARGRFLLDQSERAGLALVIDSIKASGRKLSLLSGDRNTAASHFEKIFGSRADLYFEQTPHDKLEYIRRRQAEGHRVLMIGDGLNDAGALQQSDAGIAVTEDVSLFSPACDAILSGNAFARLPKFLRFSRASVRVLKTAFVISLIYNVVGISFAASGFLSPMISAILMPLSSLSVIGFTTLATAWAARHTGVTP